MSGDGANLTTTSPTDYSEYFGNFFENFAPCNSSDLTTFGKVFLPILYSLVFILGFIGNGLVVCVLANYRNLTNLTDICIFNLALSDLLFILMLPLYSNYAMVTQWSFGDFMCRFAAASHKTGFFSSIFFMVVMSLDRYMVIMHSFKVAQYRTLKAGMAMSVVVWMLSLSVSLPAFIFTKLKNESHGMICDYDYDNNDWKLYDIFAINILGLVIPLLMMSACYFRIIPTLMNLRSAKKHRVIKLIISIVVAFFLFWAPYNISLFLKYLKSIGELQGDECTLESNLKLAVAVTEAFAYTHCCLNPIIYAFVGQKFTKRALLMMRNCMPWIPLPSTRDLSDSTYRKSSIMSRSSDVTSTFIK